MTMDARDGTITPSRQDGTPRSRRMGVRGKLLLAFAGMAGMTVAAAMVGLTSFSAVERPLTQIVGTGLPEMELAKRLSGESSGIAAAAPVLARLVRTHGETCHLAVRDRMHVLYVDKLLGNHNITVQGARVGTKLDMHCTGVGKVLLAFADPGDVDEYLASIPLPRHTPNTITDKDAFRAELARIRAQGVGFDLGEAVEDVFCVAAPVRDELGQVAAAVSLSAPVNRFTKHREEYLRSVKTAATEISRAVAADERDIPARRDVNIDYPSTTPLDGPRQLGSVPRGE